MKVVRRQAFQAHAVPEVAGHPKGPFNAELLAPPVIDRAALSDDIYPLGATAQNDFRGVTYYRCRNCEDIIAEPDVPDHRCEDTDGPH